MKEAMNMANWDIARYMSALILHEEKWVPECRMGENVGWVRGEFKAEFNQGSYSHYKAKSENLVIMNVIKN